jgi:hypothetical protein
MDSLLVNSSICYSLFHDLKINIQGALVAIPGHVHVNNEENTAWCAHSWLRFPADEENTVWCAHYWLRFPAEAEQVLSCFRSHPEDTCTLEDLFSTSFFTFLCFLLIALLLIVAPRIVRKCYPLVSKCKKPVAHLMKKITLLHKLPSGMSYVLLATSSMLMNQQYILSTVLLSRNNIKQNYILVVW